MSDETKNHRPDIGHFWSDASGTVSALLILFFRPFMVLAPYDRTGVLGLIGVFIAANAVSTETHAGAADAVP